MCASHDLCVLVGHILSGPRVVDVLAVQIAGGVPFSAAAGSV
jgi:hypothetical protein